MRGREETGSRIRRVSGLLGVGGNLGAICRLDVAVIIEHPLKLVRVDGSSERCNRSRDSVLPIILPRRTLTNEINQVIVAASLTCWTAGLHMNARFCRRAVSHRRV